MQITPREQWYAGLVDDIYDANERKMIFKRMGGRILSSQSSEGVVDLFDGMLSKNVLHKQSMTKFFILLFFCDPILFAITENGIVTFERVFFHRNVDE